MYEVTLLSQQKVNEMIEKILSKTSTKTSIGKFEKMAFTDFEILQLIISQNMHRKYSLQIIKHMQDYIIFAPTIHSKHEIKIFKNYIHEIFKLLVKAERLNNEETPKEIKVIETREIL